MSVAETTGIPDNDANREAARLQACPRCDYALHDRPDETTCPECGLAIDRRWEVFRTNRGKYRLLPPLTLTIAVVNLIIVLLIAFSRVSEKGWPKTPFESFLLASVPLVWFIMAVVFLIKARRGPIYLAVGPGGLAAEWGDGSWRKWDWGEFSQVRVSRFDGSIWLKLAGTGAHHRIDRFGRDIEAVAWAIERHRARSHAGAAAAS
ncbi:MAG: hypothetical protein SF069_13490 [Phycisphaerae bacterium]|nr:hypothetical protein [Phycisphaerae bacterium]